MLRGATETIKKYRPILYVKCDRTESLLKCLDSLGYQMFLHLPPLFNPLNFAKREENVFGDIVSRNLLCMDKSVSHNLTGFEEVTIPRAA